MSTMSFNLVMRGQNVQVDCTVGHPEPDVGIMGYYSDGENIVDEQGHTLDWELTQDEYDMLAQAIEENIGG